MIIIRTTMRTRLLRNRTHFQRLGAIAHFRDRFFSPKCLMPVSFFFIIKKQQKVTQFSPQPVQNVGRARHQGLSRQHSTSNLGDCNHLLRFFQIFSPSNYHLLKFFQIFSPLLEIINSFFIHTGESPAVKRLIVSASLAITSANEY